MSIVKIITPGSQDLGEPVAELVKVAKRGLYGTDLSVFIKRASVQFVDTIRRLDLHPGESLIHLIALGDTERYGPNRNGDGFSEAVCREYHPTFVKHARWFRHHGNKDKSKGRGIVKASIYNEQMHRIELLVALNATKEAADHNGGLIADEEMEALSRGEDLQTSMACVLDADYPVLTRDRGYIGIADIRVGDHVWTQQGRWRRVYRLNRRLYTGEVFKFRVNGLPLPLELTADHPMWAKVFNGSRKYEAMAIKARRYFKNAEVFEKESADWTNASDLSAGDRFFYKPVTRYTDYGKIADESLAAIMGYYLAEGSFRGVPNSEKVGTTIFTCNMNDSLLRRLPSLIELMYPDITVSIVPKRNCAVAVDILVHSTVFSEFLSKFVGRGCRHKLIPPEIFNADRDVKLAFIGAWLDGDGWIDKKGGHFSTANVKLALQGRDLLISIGIPTSIYKIDHAKCKTSGYKNSGMEYTLNIAHLDLWNLSGVSFKVADYPTPTQNHKRKKPAAMRFCSDGTYAYRISTIQSRHVIDAPTYNFEVEEDESYSLGGFISHNCLVSFDTCSGCGNEAKTRRDYCGPAQCVKYGGLRNNMGRTFDDGHTLYAKNPDPKFFDISRVFRNADRTAWTLGLAKAAEDYEKCLAEAKIATYGQEIGGGTLAMKVGVTLPLWFLEAGPWADTAFVSQLRTLQDLAACEHTIEKTASQPFALATSSKAQPAISAEHLAMLRKGRYTEKQLVTALVKTGCLLPLRDFLAVFSKASVEKTASVALRVSCRLPGIYSRLLEDPQFEDTLRESPYTPSGTPPSRLLLWMSKQANVWSVDRSRVVERLQLATFRYPKLVAKSRPMLKTANNDAVDRLAKEYASYQIGFVASQRDLPDFGMVCDLVIQSNRSCCR